MNNIDQTTQSNAAASEEISASTTQASAQVKQIENDVVAFRVFVSGGSIPHTGSEAKTKHAA